MALHKACWLLYSSDRVQITCIKHFLLEELQLQKNPKKKPQKQKRDFDKFLLRTKITYNVISLFQEYILFFTFYVYVYVFHWKQPSNTVQVLK